MGLTVISYFFVWKMSSICCEQQRTLLHERFVFEVDGLLCQPHLVTARWIAALVGVGSVSWAVIEGMINVIQCQLLNAFRVCTQVSELHSPPRIFVITKSLSRDCVLQTRMALQHLSGVCLRSLCLPMCYLQSMPCTMLRMRWCCPATMRI